MIAARNDKTPDPLTAQKKSFWDQPARKTSLPGKNYTRIVRSMRLVLPLIAAGIVGVLVAWPRVEETMAPIPKESVIAADQQTVGKNELINPRFESEDSEKRPFTITAARALQNAQDPDIVMLEKPTAKILFDGGASLSAESLRGAYRQKAERLLLEGKVRLSHSADYTLDTERLLVDLTQQQTWSDQPVFLQGPAGTLSATGLQTDKRNNVLIFTGPARLVLKESIKGL